MKMKVDDVIERFGGVEKMLAKMEGLDQSYPAATVAVWKFRHVIPDNAIVTLMLIDRKFDPREFGWKPRLK